MIPSNVKRKGSSDETAPLSDSGSSSTGGSRTHRPILRNSLEVAQADGDAGFAAYDDPYIPSLLSFAIEASHPLIQSWPPIRARILSALNQSRIKWLSLGVLRRRQTLKQEGDDTTIVLTVQEGNNIAVLERVEEVIYQICCSSGHSGLWVEVLEGGVNWYSGIEYETRPPGGSSISATEVDYSVGTMGGYIKLTGPNGPRIMALSCHHVLRPAPLNSMNQYTAEIAPGQGHHIRVSQPAEGARATDISTRQRNLHDAEKKVKNLQERVEYEPWRAKELEMAEKLLLIVGNELGNALEFNNDFGTLFATSGFKRSPTRHCALDWALVDVRHARIGQNKVPRLSRVPLGFELLSEEAAVVEVAELNTEDVVVKAGYKTDVTYGYYSHIKDDCNLPNSTLMTSEHVYTSRDGLPFAMKGDSGAFVLNQAGVLIGLLIAGNERAGTTYVTPIVEVLRDIQEVTGQQASLP